MPEEIGVILDNLKRIHSFKFGDLEVFTGEFYLNNSEKILISTAWSGWGKVSAARATTRLLSINNTRNIPIDLILFTGVAGAVANHLKQWDIVIAESVIQHDMDARPIFDKYVIPALKKDKIFSNKLLIKDLYISLKEKLEVQELKTFGNIYKGLIATGDMFISKQVKIEQLSREIYGLLAVEMEGAAFAQVARQENIDWIIVRVISDGANENAHDDFNDFLKKYQHTSFDLIKCFLETLLRK